MRRSHGVDGTGVGIGVLSSGVATLITGEAAGDLRDRVTVLPGQAGEGDDGTATLSILHDLAPGGELYFATGLGGPARFAANLEALCRAGADVIVDDLFDYQATIYQGGLMSQGIRAAVGAGCVYVSVAGNQVKSSAWEGDYAPAQPPADNFSTTGDSARSKSNLPAGTCVTAANPHFETFCGSSTSPPQVAAIVALSLEAAGGFHNTASEMLRAAVMSGGLGIERAAKPFTVTTAPSVRKVEISSNPPEGRETYRIGDSVEVKVTFSKTVNVTGTPLLELKVGDHTRNAGYSGGTGTIAPVFTYTVAEGDEDTDGLSVEADSLSVESGVIEDVSENAADPNIAELPDQDGQRVDGVKPSLVDSDAAAVSGAKLTLSYDEMLDGSSTPAAGDFRVTVAGAKRDVTMVAVTENAVTLALASSLVQGEAVTVSYTVPEQREAKPIQDPAGNESLAFTNQAVTNRTGEGREPAGGRLSAKTVRQIQSLLAAKARRTRAQRKVSSQLLDARRTGQRKPTATGTDGRQALGADAREEPVAVDIRADVTPEVLARIRELGGTVSNRVPRYRAIRAHLPLAAVERLAELDAVQWIRTAEEAATRGQPKRLPSDVRKEVLEAMRTRRVDLSKEDGAPAATLAHRMARALPGRMRTLPEPAGADDETVLFRRDRPPEDGFDIRTDAQSTMGPRTSEGDVAHEADLARLTYGVDGAGIGIGVLSDGADSNSDVQVSGDLPDRVTVLPEQAGFGREGTAMLEIVHDLAPGAELYFATAFGGQARFAANIEALCEAGADIIVDDVFYFREAAFQDGIVARGVNAAVAAGCVVFSSAGNAGNLNDGTAGVWEGDYAAGSPLTVNGQWVGTRHDFGEGVEANRITKDGLGFALQWADPLGASANDYDLFLVDEGGDVLRSSTDSQSGTQDPIEYISSSLLFNSVDYTDARLVIVKFAGADRYLRLDTIRGQLAVATDGQMTGHSAAASTVSVAAVDVRIAGGGAGGVFNGREVVERFSSNGPRRIFFEADGTPITPGNFSSTGGEVLQKPDLAAADAVSTSTTGFSTFGGTSAAAPHAAAIAALMLEAAGGRAHVTPAALRTAMTETALDIEAPGADRDSGAGIVMAPGAVAEVEVVAADRNGAPTVETKLADRTLAPDAAVVMIDLTNAFADPDDDTLTYTLLENDSDRMEVVLTGSRLSLTPSAPSLEVVVTVRATDHGGLSAVQAFSVTITAGNRDYDVDDDGLIEVATLAQLDVLRYDLNGDGWTDAGTDWTPYGAAFLESALGMGCPRRGGCRGYELTADLDFDTDGSGVVDENDAYWNDGAGWAPIGVYTGGVYTGGGLIFPDGDPFTALFEGNGHTLTNLFINRPTEDGIGLFGYVRNGEIRDLGLVDISVTGRDAVGGLAGVMDAFFFGLGFGCYVRRGHVTGRVSGRDTVGGVVGGPDVWVLNSYAAVRVSGTANRIGGLAGVSYAVSSSYATGRVSGTDSVGGLVGNSRSEILASYATGRVSGSGTRPSGADTCGSQGGVGGLVGNACGTIRASYATGPVSGEASVGGLVGSASDIRAYSSYWDLDTSGVRVGIGSDDQDDNSWIDGEERRSLGVTRQTTDALQSPTGYHGIYRNWNLDLDSDGASDDPWRFGTATQYPVLAVDLNGNGQATWQEFGYQLGVGPALTAATTDGQAQVDLSWTAVTASHWNPAPSLTYILTRDDGASIETLAEDLSVLQYTDTEVSVGVSYRYQVEAVVTGGARARSAWVAVIAGGANQSPIAVGTVADRTLREGGAAVVVDVAGAFRDPEDDALTYAASSSATAIATVSVSGSQITITPVVAGHATITATATDADGSDTAAAQRFTVTVWSATAVDYDTDDDGLIEIRTLAQLDAVRHDLNGDGIPSDQGMATYAAVFSEAVAQMGCAVLDGCSGYELLEDLDFDTNGNGIGDAGDDYWNDGLGWKPIVGERVIIFGVPSILSGFTATFEGNEHTVANLFIRRDDEDFVGLFGVASTSFSVIRNIDLIDVEVRGKRYVGALIGDNEGTITASYATGRVTGGDLVVGGLVGKNDGTVTASSATGRVSGNSRVGGLIGKNEGTVTASSATGRVSGDSWVGGLIGDNEGTVTASYTTGRVTVGDDTGVGHSLVVGGLAGDNKGTITASYATGDVEAGGSGRHMGGLVGDNRGTITASYATGRVAVGGFGFLLGGLAGNNEGTIAASYATGRVTVGRHSSPVGGLAGNNEGTIIASYWDTTASGIETGPGQGKTTAQLQAPTGYRGIYGTWNLDLDGDGASNDPWDFGTATQYPILSMDLDGNGQATWQEFGYQLRYGPALTATAASDHPEVELSWEPAAANHWTPAPVITYALTRDDGATLVTLVEDTSDREYTDTDVTAGVTYTYQVAALVAGGVAGRSAPVSVTARGNRPAMAVGSLANRTLLVGDAAMVEFAGAFRDPEGDALTYGATSSEPAVVTVSVSGTQLTFTPVAEGQATVTVTATDENGSNRSTMQSFGVTVLPMSTVDYDTDDDGLIEIRTLAQLDVVRWDYNGYGIVWGAGANLYAAAFPGWVDRMACGGLGCIGYELFADLDFDTNGNGVADAGDTYWNHGNGLVPIGSVAAYTATFEGNGHTISHLLVNRDDYTGLFTRAGSSSDIRNVGLINAEVTGSDYVGALVGTNGGTITGSYATGRVSGERYVGGLAGRSWGTITGSYATGRVSGESFVGGLAGDQAGRGTISGSYATGRVSGGSFVGGLAGFNSSTISGSYATGRVSGERYVGGLAGINSGTITGSYATGRVSGESDVGGLVGWGVGIITHSYWDTSTSGLETGSYGEGRTTAALQAPTGYSGIYRTWNLDLNGDGVSDDPWHFGTTAQYPVLSVDWDGNGQATWQELGYQIRTGPALTATPTTNAGQSQVELEWTEVPLSSDWTPAPTVTYTLTRDDGSTIETITENLTAREYTDTDVAGGETYIYQVAVVVDGGEAARSATVSVTVVGNKRPVAVGTLRSRRLLVGDSAMTEVGGAFRDPEGDTITYDVSSSDTTVARVTLSGTRVTIIPVAEGRTTITVTATDDGSNQSRTQQFTVTVLPTTTVDYDTDDDGLIEISNLAQLDAVRHDLNGDGAPAFNGAVSYGAAFPNRGSRTACGGLIGCVGYELRADLDFDTNASGDADAGDTYWNDGAGWVPIDAPFGGYAAIFEGNGHTISHLLVNRDDSTGLFTRTGSSSDIRNVGLINAEVTGSDYVGALVGTNGGTITGSYATGRVSGGSWVQLGGGDRHLCDGPGVGGELRGRAGRAGGRHYHT